MSREWLLKLVLVLAGLVNALPLLGIVSADMLEKLYGIDPPEGDLLILLRHRALLFGLLGAFMVTAAFRVHLQPAAVAAGVASMAGFVVLAWLEGSFGAELREVVAVDLIAVALLLAAGVFARTGPRRNVRPDGLER